MAPSKTIPWRRFATPDAQFTYASSGSQSSPDTMKFRLSGKNGGEQIQIDWGDGTFETLNLTTQRQPFSHDYTAAGDFAIQFFQANNKLDRFDANRNGSLKLNVSDLLKGARVYDFERASVTGFTKDLPTGADVYNFRDTAIEGAVKDLPAALEYLFTLTSVTGTVADLPGGADIYDFGFTAVTGQTVDIPPGALDYSFQFTGVGGPVKDLPANADIYNFRRAGGVTGLYTEIPTGASSYDFEDQGLDGDLNFLHTFSPADNLLIDGNNLTNYTSGTFQTDYSGSRLRINEKKFQPSLSSSEVDNFLIDLEASGASNGTLNIAGSHAARTSNSDAAVSALQSRGWSITVNT